MRQVLFAFALVPFLMVCVNSSSAATPTPLPDTTHYLGEDVRYANGTVPLAAELLLPNGGGTFPGAVIIQGSGQSDRTNPWARAVAEELVDRGVAVLLTDKRGSGASGGDWLRADFHELAGDALAGVEYLRERQEIDPLQIGLVGLSQGGWIAPLAAARSDQVAFVIAVSGTSVTFAEQSFHEIANTARQAGFPEDAVSEVIELNRATARYITTGDWESYARARERGLTRSWRPIAEGFPGAPEVPIWHFLRGVADYDPIPYWVQLEQPVLVVYGSEDERDNVPVAESVRRLEYAFGVAHKMNYHIVVAPGVGHALWTDFEARRFAPEFLEELSNWLPQYVSRNSP